MFWKLKEKLARGKFNNTGIWLLLKNTKACERAVRIHSGGWNIETSFGCCIGCLKCLYELLS